MSTYAISDLHGRLDLYTAINEWLKPEDKVICLGDCGDRGPQGWETIKAVYDNPQWDYYMGNHEHMLLHAMYDYFLFTGKSPVKFTPVYEDALYTLRHNGGYSTYKGWVKDGADLEWVHRLENLPYSGVYKNLNGINILLSHAGFTPLREKIYIKNFDLIWDRDHIGDKYSEEWAGDIVVHGHTPCTYIYQGWKPEDGSIWYADSKKICIDMHTYKTGTALLLNLDTFDEQIFMIE